MNIGGTTENKSMCITKEDRGEYGEKTTKYVHRRLSRRKKIKFNN
jgi:hypothetical protein